METCCIIWRPFFNNLFMEDVYIGRHSCSFDENLLIEDYLLRHHCIFWGLVVHVADFCLFGALICTFSCIYLYWGCILHIPRHNHIFEGMPDPMEWYWMLEEHPSCDGCARHSIPLYFSNVFLGRSDHHLSGLIYCFSCWDVVIMIFWDEKRSP